MIQVIKMAIQGLKDIRKEKGLTQDDLAVAVGVKRAVISKYENGSISPSLDMLEKIAEALNVPVGSFLSPELSRNLTETVTSVLDYAFSRKPDMAGLKKLMSVIQPKDIPIMTKFVTCILSMSPDDKFYMALDNLLDAIQEQNEQ